MCPGYKVSELFRPGRVNALRNLVTWSGRRRELYFFLEARLDGLVSRKEDIGKKVCRKESIETRETYKFLSPRFPYESLKTKGMARL